MGGLGEGQLPAIAFGTLEDNLPPGITYARQARRLYVGGIKEEGTEENIATFFNEKMRENNFALDDKVDVQADQPVISVQINLEKSYAFLEVSLPLPEL